MRHVSTDSTLCAILSNKLASENHLLKDLTGYALFAVVSAAKVIGASRLTSPNIVLMCILNSVSKLTKSNVVKIQLKKISRGIWSRSCHLGYATLLRF